MSAPAIPCGTCPGEIGLGVAVCPGCGRPVTDQDRAVLQVRLEGGDFAAHERGKRVREGSKWIGALAILFAVSGPILFAVQSMEADKAVAHLAQFEEDEVLQPINGKTYTAGALRREVAREPYQVLIASLILAALMGALWLWARRAPLPAIGCALALFVVVQVVGAVVDPSSLYKGLIIKVLAFVALGKGLKAALAARAALQRPLP
jgi:hypothetical protein